MQSRNSVKPPTACLKCKNKLKQIGLTQLKDGNGDPVQVARSKMSLVYRPTMYASGVLNSQ
jgi:hypothetical protein